MGYLTWWKLCPETPAQVLGKDPWKWCHHRFRCISFVNIIKWLLNSTGRIFLFKARNFTSGTGLPRTWKVFIADMDCQSRIKHKERLETSSNLLDWQQFRAMEYLAVVQKHWLCLVFQVSINGCHYYIRLIKSLPIDGVKIVLQNESVMP